MIDAADREKIEASRNELHNLLDKPQLQGIPVSMEYWLILHYIIIIFIIIITSIITHFYLLCLKSVKCLLF